jgi:hypothetical protein
MVQSYQNLLLSNEPHLISTVMDLMMLYNDDNQYPVSTSLMMELGDLVLESS